MPAKCQHRTFKGLGGIGGRLTIGIDRPAFRNVLARPAMQFDLSTRNDAV